MVTSVLAGFNDFIKAISISGNQQETSKARKDRIVELLEKEHFTIIDAFPTGSIPKRTGVKGCDLDVMVVLHYTNHIKDKQPSEVLQAVRDALAEYRTNVRKNGQAVTLYYETWPNVDIVPVYRSTNDDKSVNHYGVPDMNSTPERWIKSRPMRHASTISERATSFGKEFRHIIRMAKWWNQKHSDYLQSYHIEVLALQAISGIFSTYSESMCKFFDSAYASLSATSYTSNLYYEDSWVDSYLSSNDRQEVTKRLKTAKDLAHEAWEAIAGSNSDVEKAINLWQRIFVDKFPSFG